MDDDDDDDDNDDCPTFVKYSYNKFSTLAQAIY